MKPRHSPAGKLEMQKSLDGFQGCHENALNESCEMSPHLIGLGWHPRSLLWPASGSGLDMIWKLKCQLRHIKWGLILKLSLRPFLSHPWNPLRGFFAFRLPLPDCEMKGNNFFWVRGHFDSVCGVKMSKIFNFRNYGPCSYVLSPFVCIQLKTLESLKCTSGSWKQFSTFRGHP